MNPVDGSTPSTGFGFATSSMVWVSAPVPQPTSSHSLPFLTCNQEMNSCATSLLHRPTYGSYASPTAHTSARVICCVMYVPPPKAALLYSRRLPAITETRDDFRV